jgi:hypothetical protein
MAIRNLSEKPKHEARADTVAHVGGATHALQTATHSEEGRVNRTAANDDLRHHVR